MTLAQLGATPVYSAFNCSASYGCGTAPNAPFTDQVSGPLVTAPPATGPALQGEHHGR